MNHPNIAFVKSLYVAFQQRRIETILDAVAPNVDWQTVGRAKDYPAFGPRKGRAAVEEFFGIVAENETFSEFSPREFFCDSDRVFAFGRYAGTMKKSGRPFETEMGPRVHHPRRQGDSLPRAHRHGAVRRGLPGVTALSVNGRLYE
jgi:ketosteroid isomerase-like protein